MSTLFDTKHVLLFFNMSGGEIFLIILVALMFFGSKRIPDVARNMGKFIHKMKEASADIQRDIREGAEQIKKDTDINKHLED